MLQERKTARAAAPCRKLLPVVLRYTGAQQKMAPKHWGTLDLTKTNQCECEVGAATRAHRGGDIVMIGIKPLYISICVSLVFLACYFGLCNGIFQFFPKPVFTHWSWKPLFKGCATRGASSFYPMRARANSGCSAHRPHQRGR